MFLSNDKPRQRDFSVLPTRKNSLFWYDESSSKCALEKSIEKLENYI